MLPDAKRFNLGYLCARAALATPDKPAVIDLYGGKERIVSYRELEQHLDRMAAVYASPGVDEGGRVAILIGNRFEFVVATYGAMRAGLVPVMVNTKLGLDGLQQTIADADAAIAVIDPAVNAAALAATTSVAHRIVLGGGPGDWLDYQDALDKAPDTFEPAELSSTAIAELCFTSGSTGRPKGVMIPHRATVLKLHIYANHFKTALRDDVRSLVHLPIFHGNGRISIGSAFETGGVVVIQEKFEPRSVLQNIAKYRISYILSVAPAYVAMLKETDLLESLDFSSLKYPLIGSAPAGGDIISRVRQAMGVKLLHTYGSTEAGAVFQHPFDEISPAASCGRPLPGSEVKLIDPATGEESETGETGELWIRNEFTASGYWRRPDLTTEKFIGAWYASGDLLEKDDAGYFYFKGRSDDMFNVGGEKVYPAEVEGLLQTHPSVLGASVVAVSHPTKGEVPAAVVVLARNATVSVDELQQFCIANGPAYAYPRSVIFVDAFPLGPTGKVDRKQVRELVAAAASTVLTGDQN